MADASDTSPYILAAPDSTLPNSRALLASGGLVTQDTGGEGTFTINTVGNLQTLNEFGSPGFITYDATLPGITARSLEGGSGISITTPDGNGANPVVSVVADSTTQQVNSLSNGLFGSTRSSLNFVPSGSISITIGDNSLDNRTDINIAGTVAAPQDSTYIIQTTDPGLPNAQSLGLLTDGLLKVTVTDSTGVLSTATANTDYQVGSPILTSISGVTPTVGSLLVGSSSTTYEGFPESSTPGTVLTSNGAAALPSWQAPATGNLVEVLPNPTLTQTLVGNTTYIAINNAGGPTVFTLPPGTGPGSAVPGTFYTIIGGNQEGWMVNLNAGQTIAIGPIFTTGGSINSTTTGPYPGTYANDSITIWCVTSLYFIGVNITGTIQVN